jgi:hypothetical protein
MKIYIVVYADDDDYKDTDAVFSSLEVAKNYIDNKADYFIEEWELDGDYIRSIYND